MPSSFNWLSYTRQLESAGVPKEQAEAHAQALVEVLSSSAVHPRDLASMEERINSQFDEIKAKFVVVNARFEAIEVRFNAIDIRFNAMDARFDQLDKRLDNHDSRFDKLDTRFDKLDENFRALALDLKESIVTNKGVVNLLKWMGGTAVVLSLFGISLCITIFSKFLPH